MPLLEAILPGVISAASTLFTNAASARAAERNRQFQERMSSTAHQREVLDLRRAGINPALRQMSGASTPSGEMPSYESPGAAGVASALQAKLLEAQIGEIRARTALTTENTQTVAEMRDPQIAIARQTLSKLESETDLTDVQRSRAMQELRDLLPLMLERARKEIDLTVSSARAAQAKAVLDELAQSGAVNEAQFNEFIGSGGPLTRFVVEMIRMLRTGGRR